jgi:HEAT repeat protein
MVDAADLIIVGHFENRVNDRHARATIVHPMRLYGQLDTNKTIVAEFNTTKLTAFVEPEAAWIFFLLPAHSELGSLEYRRVVGGYDSQGILAGTQENIRAVKRLLRAKAPPRPAEGAPQKATTIEELIALLGDKKAPVASQTDAIETLKRAGSAAKPAIPVLTALLSDERAAAAALNALLAIGPDATQAIVVALTNQDGVVRAAAANGLGEIGPAAQRAIPDLIRVLKDPFHVARISAAQSLGTLRAHPEIVVPALVDALSDEENAVRQEAARSLGEFGAAARSAVPALLRDLAKGENVAASQALRKIDPEAVKLK